MVGGADERAVPPALASNAASPSITARDGSSGVESSLWTCSRPPVKHTRSVNVPPVSTPIRIGADPSLRDLFRAAAPRRTGDTDPRSRRLGARSLVLGLR